MLIEVDDRDVGSFARVKHGNGPPDPAVAPVTRATLPLSFSEPL
jgi:hypothetical protein